MDFNWIRASILVPFQHHVHYFLHAFFKYWFSINFWRTFLNSWMPRTTFSIGKQTVWSISAFFAKVWQINDLCIRFGIILEGFWYTFGIFFRHHFLHRFWDGILWIFRWPRALSSHLWTRRACRGGSKSIQRAHLFSTLGPPLVQRPQKHGPLHKTCRPLH